MGSHDLSDILDKCVNIESEFEKLYNDAESLTPYSTAFRYMDIGMGLIPSPDLVIEAMESSLKILNFVKSKINNPDASIRGMTTATVSDYQHLKFKTPIVRNLIR